MTNKRIRRFLSSVLAIVMVLSLCTPCLAAAAELQDSQSQELTQETDAAESEAAPAPESVKETETEAAPAPESVKETETEAAPAPESVKETEPESTTKTEPVTETEAASEPETLSEKQPEDSVTPDALEQTEAQDVVDGEHVTDSGSAQDDEKEARDAENKEDVSTDKTTAPEKVQTASESFSESISLDGVVISVNAEPGVFPEGSVLKVAKVEASSQRRINGAVEEAREEGINVAASYAFDIKVIGPDEEEVQPADGKKVHVSFSTAEVADRNLKTQVYHIAEEENGAVTAEKLDVHESGDTATAETDGFSYYTVEFTYDSMQYVMDGDSSILLSAILDEVGLTGVVTEVSVSNENLFSVHGEAGTWMVYAHQAFSTEEWMKVTINGVEYEITVTDATLSPWTFHNSGWGSGEMWYIYCPPGSMYSKFSAEKDGTTKPAYCLDRDLSSPGPSVNYLTASYPTTKHYQVAKLVAALGYPNNSPARIKEMTGYDLTAIQAQQATQVAIGAAQKAVKEGWSANTAYNNYVGVRSGYQSVYDYSKALCTRALELLNDPGTAAKYTITPTVTSTALASKIAVSITPYRAYGPYKIVLKNLPFGTLLSTGQNTRVVGSDGTLSTASNQAVSGTVTIRGLAGTSGANVAKFTLSSIPRGTSDRTITISTVSFAKLAATNEVEWGKSPDSSHQNMFIAGMSEGTTVSASNTAVIPKKPVGSITVVKRDATNNKTLAGCVFGLKKWNGSAYIDAGVTKTTGSDGKAAFTGLTTDSASGGKYQVYEVSAPEGYDSDAVFFCNFVISSGWYKYKSKLVSEMTDTLSNGGTVNATINGASRSVLTVSKSGDSFSATVYQYDTPKPPDTFSITMHKRDLNTGADLSGAAYQLYKADASNQWIPYQSGSVNDDGDLIFSGLHLEDSSNGKFRITETGMTNPIYQCDETFEVILDPVTGDWSYAGSCVDSQSGTFTAAGTVNADLSLSNGSSESRVIVSAAKASENGPFVFDVYQDDPPLDVFSITVNKRSLDGDMLLDGAVYQLYVTNAAGKWEWVDEKTVENGVAVFDALDCSSSYDGRFRIIESQMTNSGYMVDGTFEAIVNPATGEWWYTSAFTGNQHGTAISSDITAKVDTKDGSTDDKVILTGSRNPQTSRYDFSIWQDDAKRTNQNLTVRKIVNMDGTEEPVSGVTFSLMHKNGNDWTAIGSLEESLRIAGRYELPKDTDDNWLFPMVEGDTYKVAETAAAPGILNSGWESEEFVWKAK